MLWSIKILMVKRLERDLRQETGSKDEWWNIWVRITRFGLSIKIREELNEDQQEEQISIIKTWWKKEVKIYGFNLVRIR
jgi:hypothetical protein